MKRSKQFDVRGTLALAGGFKLLSCSARGCVLPFLTLFFRQLGLSPAMTGVIMAAKNFISLFWSPLASMLSKHYDKRRLVIVGSLVCSSAVALVLSFMPSIDLQTLTGFCNGSDLGVAPTTGLSDSPLSNSVEPILSPLLPHAKDAGVIPTAKTFNATEPAYTVSIAASLPVREEHHHHHLANETSHELSQANDSAWLNSSLRASNRSHPMKGKRSLNSEQGEKGEEEKAEEGGAFEFLGSLKVMDAQHQLFFLVLIAVSAWEFVSAPLEWTVDDGLYEYLDFVDASDRYSSAGVWGLLGAACGVGGTGLLVSRLDCLIGGGGVARSAVHFYCYAALTSLVLVLAAVLPLHLNKKSDKANGLLKAVKLVQGHPRALLCAATALLVGAAGSAVDNFLLWGMQDAGSSEMHDGLSLALGLLSQAAFPHLVGRLFKPVVPDRLLILGCVSFALQCFYYSYLWGPWAALPAQLVSCFSGGALWWAVQVQCEDAATLGAERNVLRVYQSLSLGLGAGLGSLGGGFVVERFGVAWLFRGAAAGLVVWSLCLPLLQWKAPHQRRINYSRLLAADASEASDTDSDQERDWLDRAMEEDGSNNNYGRRINH